MSDDEFTTDTSNNTSEYSSDAEEAPEMSPKEIAAKLFGKVITSFVGPANSAPANSTANSAAANSTANSASANSTANSAATAAEDPDPFIAIHGERGEEFRLKLINGNCTHNFPFEFVDSLPCRNQVYDICFDIAEKVYSIITDYTDKLLIFEKETMTFYFSYNDFERLAIQFST